MVVVLAWKENDKEYGKELFFSLCWHLLLLNYLIHSLPHWLAAAGKDYGPFYLVHLMSGRGG